MPVTDAPPRDLATIALPPALGSAIKDALVATSASGGDDVARLVPPRQLAKGLADKSLEYATSEDGRGLAIIKQKASGRIAGHARVERVGGGPPVPAAAAAAAWQVLAVATSQHYLVEISGKLEVIEEGVSELIAREQEKDRAALGMIAAGVDKLSEKRVAGLPLDDVERQRAEGWLERADSVRRQALGNATRMLRGADAQSAGSMKAHLHQVTRLTREALPDYFLAQEATRLTLLVSSILLSFESDPQELAFEAGNLERTARDRVVQLRDLARDFAAVEHRTLELDAEPDLGDRISGVLGKRWAPHGVSLGARWYSRRKVQRERAVIDLYGEATKPIRETAQLELEASTAEATLELTEDGTVLLHAEPMVW